MISDCSSIRMQSTNCCLSSASDICFPPLPICLGAHLSTPQIPCAHSGGLVYEIRQPAFFRIERGNVCGIRVTSESDSPMLDARIHLCVDGTEYGCLQRRAAGDTPMRTHQHDVLAAQGRSECNTLFTVA